MSAIFETLPGVLASPHSSKVRGPACAQTEAVGALFIGGKRRAQMTKRSFPGLLSPHQARTWLLVWLEVPPQTFVFATLTHANLSLEWSDNGVVFGTLGAFTAFEERFQSLPHIQSSGFYFWQRQWKLCASESVSDPSSLAAVWARLSWLVAGEGLHCPMESSLWQRSYGYHQLQLRGNQWRFSCYSDEDLLGSLSSYADLGHASRLYSGCTRYSGIVGWLNPPNHCQQKRLMNSSTNLSC